MRPPKTEGAFKWIVQAQYSNNNSCTVFTAAVSIVMAAARVTRSREASWGSTRGCTNAYTTHGKTATSVSLGQDRRAFLAEYSAVKLSVIVEFYNLRERLAIFQIGGRNCCCSCCLGNGVLWISMNGGELALVNRKDSTRPFFCGGHRTAE